MIEGSPLLHYFVKFLPILGLGIAWMCFELATTYRRRGQKPIFFGLLAIGILAVLSAGYCAWISFGGK